MGFLLIFIIDLSFYIIDNGYRTEYKCKLRMAELKLSENLKLLMFQKDIKTAQLARELALPQQTVQRIVTGVTPRPHKSTLETLASFFGISIEQLKGHKPLPGSEAHISDKINKVHTIAWSEIPSWPLSKEQLQEHETSILDRPAGPNVFAVKMRDSSMEPLFPEGTLLIIDPDIELHDRRYVIAKLGDQPEATFRQLLVDLNNQYLKPLNPDFNQFGMVKLSNKDKIYGVLVQARHNYIF